MKLSALTLFVVGSMCLATSAWAQDEGGGDAVESAPAAPTGTNGVTKQQRSLSFGIPSGGNGYANGAAGVWLFATPDVNLGINLGLALDTGGDDPVWDILLAPAVRYYLSMMGNVMPFVLGQLNFRIAAAGGDTSDPELGLAGGLGLEWFVTPVFSIAGHVGLGIDVLRSNNQDPLALGTFTSGLTANLYGW